MKHKLHLLLSGFMTLMALPAGAQVTDTSAWWTHMTGTVNHGVILGVYGTQGTAHANNTTGTRSGAGGGIIDKDGNLWLFGGFGVDEANAANRGMNDLWKYDMAMNQWAWMGGAKNAFSPGPPYGTYGTRGVAHANNWPGGRGFIRPLMDSDGNFWVFGGSNGFGESPATGSLNDLWKYDMTTGHWTWMHGSKLANQFGVYGTMGQPHSSNTPGARGMHMAWMDKDDNIWIFGGNGYAESGAAGPLSDLWKYSIKDEQWTWVAGAKAINQAGSYTGTVYPGARFSLTGWTGADGKLWLFGGVNASSQRFSDLWRFDPATGQWTFVKGDNTANQFGVYGSRGVPNAANKPGGRYVMVSWTDVNGDFWMYGGYGYGASGAINYLSDVWRYRPADNVWTWMKGANNAQASLGAVAGTKTVPAFENTPGYKQAVTSWVDGNGNFWMIGGGNDQGLNNSFWRLAPSLPQAPAQPGNFLVSKASVCKTETGVVYRINKVAGATSYEWAYTPAGGVTITGSDTSVTLDFSAAAANGTLSVVAKNAGGSSSARTLAITVHDLPAVPAITGTTSVCVGGTTTLSNTVSGGTWLTTNSAIATVNSSTGVVVGITAGTTNISYRVINGSNCTTTVSVPVTVNALPVVAAITGTTSVCVNGTTNLSNTTSGGTWLSANTSTATVSGTGVVTGVAAGTTNISYRVINGSNCTTTVSVPVTVNALPAVSVSPSGARSVCQGDSLLLTATSGSGVQYEWKRGTVTVGGNNATYYASVAGDYRVTVTQGSCAATSALVTLTVNPLPVASVTAGGATEVCAGETVTLTAASVTGADYQWKDGNGNVGANSNSYAAAATGSYRVVVTYTATGCADSTTPVDVFVYDRPVVSLAHGDTAFCAGGAVRLEVLSQDTGLTYRWKDGSATIQLASAYFLEITESGDYTVVVGRANVPGCEDTTNKVTVTVHPLPITDVTWDGEALHATPGYTSYQWNTGGQDIAGATDSVFVPSSDGGYSVTVTDDNDCSAASPVYNVRVGIADAAGIAAEVQVYPNPANDKLYINAPMPVEVVLSGMDGRLLFQQQHTGAVDISRYANGVYLLRIINKDGICIKTERVVKQGGQ